MKGTQLMQTKAAEKKVTDQNGLATFLLAD
jgi:hypothetical protein